MHDPMPRSSLGRRPLFRALVLLLTLLGVGGLTAADTPQAPVALYSHPRVNAESLSPEEFRRVFLGLQGSWDDGQRVVLILPPPGSLEMAWLCAELRVSERLLKRGLMEKSLRGDIRKPQLARDAEDAIQMVLENGGGITPLLMQDRSELQLVEVK